MGVYKYDAGTGGMSSSIVRGPAIFRGIATYPRDEAHHTLSRTTARISSSKSSEMCKIAKRRSRAKRVVPG